MTKQSILYFILPFLLFNSINSSGQSSISKKWDTIYYIQDKQYYVLNLVGNTQAIYFDSLKYDNNRPITILIKNNTDDTITISYKSLISSWVTFKQHSGTHLMPGEYYSISPIFNAKRLAHTTILNAHFAFSYSVRNQSTETIFRLKGHVLLDSLPAFNSNEKNDFPLGQKPTFQAQDTSLDVGSQVTYSPLQHAYYFYWVNKETPTFNWDTIHGNEWCVIHIINNSKDTLMVDKVLRTSSSAIYWDYYPSKQRCIPGDTIRINSKFFKREGGPFNCPISISYHSSSNFNSQYWHLNSKGFYAPKKEQELKNSETANPNLTFYPNGQIKSKKNPKSVSDSLPIYVEYYENGVVKLEEFNRIGIRKRAYDQLGRIKNQWDDNYLRTEYYSNGNVKLKETKGPYTNSSTDITHYFENGCLKKEEFGNQTVIKEYDSLVCGKLTYINSKYLNGKIKTHHKEGEIIGQTLLPYVGGRIEVKGEFSNGILRHGVVSYYSQTGVLLFENKIANAKRDNILSESEEQGRQINLLDVKGRKTGLWITDKVTKQPITLTNDYYSASFYDTKSFDFYQYEYINGDTAAQVLFHDYGGISNYLYIKEKEERINSNKEFAKVYYTNGYIAFMSYQLKNGMLVGIKYSEEKENLIVSGKKGHCGEMIFKNNKLIEIHSVKPELPKMDNVSNESSYSNQLSLQDSCVEKGQFKHFELYNGTIYYYKKGGKLIQTEKVVNGIIQGNPRVNFKEPKFHSAALENDLNFNGWSESNEVDNLKYINLYAKPEELDGLKWQELKNFKNLEVLYYHSLVYRLEDYANYDSLKLAIKQNKGKQIPRQRYSWEGPYDYSWEKSSFVIIVDSTKNSSKLKEQIVDFPDLEAAFLGGYDSLKIWLKNNLVYPKNQNVQGKVFVSFVVLKDGSVADVKIEKGLHPDFDKEAIRLIKAMPKWKPAIWNGLDVASRVSLPIIFKIN